MTGEFMRRVRRLQWPVIAALALACVLVLSKLFSAHIVQSDDRKEGGNMSPD